MYTEGRELLPAEPIGINDLSYPSESFCPPRSGGNDGLHQPFY